MHGARLHPRRYLSLAKPRRCPCPSFARPPSHRSARAPRGFRSDAARRPPAIFMADDAVAGAAAGPSCSSSRRQQHHDDDDGCHRQHDVMMLRRTRSGRAFPPPISVIGKGGRPWLSLRAHREGGRLVLREMRLPSQELLQPCKEDGRFKLLIHTEAGGRLAAAPQERHGKDHNKSATL